MTYSFLSVEDTQYGYNVKRRSFGAQIVSIIDMEHAVNLREEAKQVHGVSALIIELTATDEELKACHEERGYTTDQVENRDTAYKESDDTVLQLHRDEALDWIIHHIADFEGTNIL